MTTSKKLMARKALACLESDLGIKHSPSMLAMLLGAVELAGAWRLIDALVEGSWCAEGFCHPLTPNANLERIPAQLWRVLDLDFNSGAATAGEVKYTGLRFCKSEPDQPRLTVAAETRCRDWLAEQMKSSKAFGKAIYQTRAVEEFPGLSAKAFGRAWDNARKEPTTHPSWRKRGPVPSL